MNYKQIEENEEMKAYFNTLPPIEQESLIHSGVDLTSLEEMKNTIRMLSGGTLH